MKTFLTSLMVLLSCFWARAVSPSFQTFDTATMIVDQQHNFIGVKVGGTNGNFTTYQNIGFFNYLGTNYFFITGTLTNNTTGSTGVSTNAYYAITATNSPDGTPLNEMVTGSVYTNAGPDTITIGHTTYLKTNSFAGGGGSGTLTNVVFTNAGPDTIVFGGVSYLKTNSFGGGGITSFAKTNGDSIVIGSVGVLKTNFYSAVLNTPAITFSTTPIVGGLQLGATLGTATSSALGVVKPDNSTITISGGVLSAVGSASTVTNIAGGQGIAVTQAGGSNIVAMLQQPFNVASFAPTNVFYTNVPSIVIANTLYFDTNWDSYGSSTAVTNGYPWGVLYDPLGVGAAAAFNATNGYPWSVLYDPAGAGATAAFNSTNGFPWGVLYAPAYTVPQLETISLAPTNVFETNSTSALIGGKLYVRTNAAAVGGITAGTGDVTFSGSGSVVTTLANIPTSTPMAGSLFDTAMVAPATPASGKGQIYEDSTSKNLALKNDAGAVNHGIQTRTTTTSSWITSIADDGSTAIAQPSVPDISTNGMNPAPVAGQTLTYNGYQFSASNAASGGSGISSLALTSSVTPSVIGTTGFIPAFSSQAQGAIQHLAMNLTYNIGTANGAGMAAGDMNGDGIPDIVIDAFSATVVYTNKGLVFTSASSFAQTSLASGVSLADVNGDGSLDAICSSIGGNYINVLTNSGTGVLAKLGTNYTFGNGANYITTIPANLDGNPGVDFFAFDNKSATQIFTNNGSGIFVVSTNIPGVLTNVICADLGDMNGDGRIDLVMCPQYPYAVNSRGFIIMTNNGAGVFQYWITNLTGVSSGLLAVCVADFNGDGKLDVATVNAASGSSLMVVYTNNGSGFGAYSSNSFNSTGAGNYKLSAADFNQDGKMDIILTPSGNTGIVIYTNAGYGFGFGAALTNLTSSAIGAPIFTPVADFNGDGWPDYAVYNTAGGAGVDVRINTPIMTGNFAGNGTGITNGNITISYSSSAVTPAAAWQTNNTSFGVLNLNTNNLPWSLNALKFINGTVMTANTTATATFNTSGYSEHIYNTSASTLGTLALTLSTSAVAGQVNRYTTEGIVTALTVTGTVSVGSAITTLTANQSVAWQAINSTTWVRIQ